MLDIHHRHDPVIRMSRHGFQNTPTRQCSSTGSSSNQDDATTTTTTTTNNITNAFDVLGVPQSFDIDLQKLKQNYRTLMARHHPDVAWQHNDNNNDENNDTTTDAAVITHAYKQLTNPHQRAVHLLELLGHPLEEGTALAVDMEFLQEVISIRERVDAILLEHDHHGHDDDALGGGELRALYEENLQKLQSTCRQLTQAFDVDRNLELAQRWTGELQYWNRIDETIRERLDTTALDDDDNNNNNNKSNNNNTTIQGFLVGNNPVRATIAPRRQHDNRQER